MLKGCMKVTHHEPSLLSNRLFFVGFFSSRLRLIIAWRWTARGTGHQYHTLRGHAVWATVESGYPSSKSQPFWIECDWSWFYVESEWETASSRVGESRRHHPPTWGCYCFRQHDHIDVGSHAPTSLPSQATRHEIPHHRCPSSRWNPPTLWYGGGNIWCQSAAEFQPWALKAVLE